MPMATKLGTAGVYHGGFLPRSHRPLDHLVLQVHVTNSMYCYKGLSRIKTWSRGHVPNQICYFSTTNTRPPTITCPKVATSYEGLPPIKSHHPLSMCSFEIT